ncbi:MAG: sigma-70 family RNA polymerase sigma factor [Acidimicrobiales bacterium]
MDELPDAERHTLLLYAWEELSYEEIAAALDVPVGTVRSRLNRARRRLRAARSAGERAPRPIHARPEDEHRTEDTLDERRPRHEESQSVGDLRGAADPPPAGVRWRQAASTSRSTGRLTVPEPRTTSWKARMSKGPSAASAR